MPKMLNRSRLLSALELLSAGAFTAGVSVAGYGLAGWLGGVAAGLTVGGAIGVYLANSYAIGAVSD